MIKIGAPGRKKFELFGRHARLLDRISRSCVNSISSRVEATIVGNDNRPMYALRRRSLMCAGSLHDQISDSASSILNMSPPDKRKTDLPADPFSCSSPSIAGDYANIDPFRNRLGSSRAQILRGTNRGVETGVSRGPDTHVISSVNRLDSVHRHVETPRQQTSTAARVFWTSRS